MSNVNVFPDVLSTLLLLQKGNIYKLQPKILRSISRSSCPEVFWKKKLLLKLCTEFTGKHLCWSPFNKVAGLQTCNFIKKRLKYRCFPVNFAKYLGTPISKNIYKRLLLHLKYYIPANNTAEVVAEYSKTETARIKKLCYESLRGTSKMFFSLYTGVVPAICSYYKL